MFEISPSGRVRRSPYYDATVEEGVRSFSTYNNMLMPTGYGDPEGEYDRLVNGVSQWDVAVERQVQIAGPDAAKLTQILCPRDISKCIVGQGKYVTLCNHSGVIINDPILLKLADDKYWLSIADSNIWFWARAIAAERNLDVQVTEPDVSPLAVQGPMAEEVVASIFGDWIRELKYFWFGETEVEGIPLAVARSGWSKQGGFELYLMDRTKGTALWNIVREAGTPFGIGPGYPNPSERIESGLLSWGADTDDTTTPYDVGLGRFVDVDVPDDVVGIEALRRVKADGATRQQLGIVLDSDHPKDLPPIWVTISKEGKPIGHMTSGVWSFKFRKMSGLALVASSVAVGDKVTLMLDDSEETGTLVSVPFK